MLATDAEAAPAVLDAEIVPAAADGGTAQPSDAAPGLISHDADVDLEPTPDAGTAPLVVLSSSDAATPAGVYGPNPACASYNRDALTCNFSGRAYFWGAWWDCDRGCLEWLGDGTGQSTTLPAGVYAPNSACVPYNQEGYTCNFGGTAYFWGAWWDCSGGCLEWLGTGGSKTSALPEGVYGTNRACTQFNRDGYTCNFAGAAYFWNAWWDCNGGCLEWLGDDGGRSDVGLPAGVYGPDAACTPYNRDGYTCNFAGAAYFWDAWWDCNGGCLEWLGD